MKKILWVVGVISAIALLILGLLVFYFFFGDGHSGSHLGNSRRYVKNYFAVIGLPKDHLYSTVKEVYGEPLSIVPDKEDDYYFKAQYDGIEFLFQETVNDNAIIVNAHIYSPQFRFGRKKIGVGSTREEIERVYKNMQKVVNDKDSYIDDITWIHFYFDENQRVNEILMYTYGP